jgi:hypothetical protein
MRHHLPTEVYDSGQGRYAALVNVMQILRSVGEQDWPYCSRMAAECCTDWHCHIGDKSSLTRMVLAFYTLL